MSARSNKLPGSTTQTPGPTPVPRGRVPATAPVPAPGDSFDASPTMIDSSPAFLAAALAARNDSASEFADDNQPTRHSEGLMAAMAAREVMIGRDNPLLTDDDLEPDLLVDDEEPAPAPAPRQTSRGTAVDPATARHAGVYPAPTPAFARPAPTVDTMPVAVAAAQPAAPLPTGPVPLRVPPAASTPGPELAPSPYRTRTTGLFAMPNDRPARKKKSPAKLVAAVVALLLAGGGVAAWQLKLLDPMIAKITVAISGAKAPGAAPKTK